MIGLNELADELVSLLPNDEAPPAWSLEHFCGGHKEQLAFCRDRSNWIHVMCARQSGKTQGCDAVLLDNALSAPRSTNLLLGLKGTGVRVSNWFPIWNPLLDRYDIVRKSNETEMLSVFPNQARVMFAGTDDLSNIKKYLGNRLDNSVIIVDECQDQPDEVLRYILRTLLPPMCTPTTRVILAGVLPDVPTGFFYELAADKELAEAPELQRSRGFSHHEWGRAANVHTPEAMTQLRDYRTEHGIPDDDPQILRDWFVKRTWDKGVTAYGYDLSRNGYNPTEPAWMDDEIAWIRETVLARYPGRADLMPIYGRTQQPHSADARYGIMAAVPYLGVDTFACSIDQARGDRFAAEVIGWGEKCQKVQQVFEFSTPRNCALTLGQAAPVLKVIAKYYGPSWWRMDGVQNDMDTFAVDYGIPAITAPNKADLPGQVKRNKDLLQQGKYDVMIGSALEQDYQRARRDLSSKVFRWLSTWHPDPSEAARYALSDYYDVYKPPKPVTIFDNPILKRLMAANQTGDLPDYR